MAVAQIDEVVERNAGLLTPATGRPVEEVGTVSERTAVGHGPRGLQPGRQRLGLLHATIRRAPAPIAGARTAWPASRTTIRCSALRSPSGTARDPILKERLFGLTNSEGNHGEDVKEYYFYLDSTPTHSYMKYLYKYPQAAYPYADLVETNRQRGRHELEYELLDTGVFDDDRYFDVFVEYAKAGPEDVLIKISVANRGPEAASSARAADALVPQHLVVDDGGAKPVLQRVSRRGSGPRPSHRPALSGIAPRLLSLLRGDAAAALHRERDQQRAAVRRAECLAVCQGRHQQLCGEREPGRRSIPPAPAPRLPPTMP